MPSILVTFLIAAEATRQGRETNVSLDNCLSHSLYSPLPSPLMPLMTRQPVSFHFCCFVISFDGKIRQALRS